MPDNNRKGKIKYAFFFLMTQVSELRPTSPEEWRPSPLVRHPSKSKRGHKRGISFIIERVIFKMGIGFIIERVIFLYIFQKL